MLIFVQIDMGIAWNKSHIVEVTVMSLRYKYYIKLKGK